MKIKSRNLLTVILAMLCAVAIALGVSFALPKNETKSANAATSTPTISFGVAKYHTQDHPGGLSSNRPTNSLSYNIDMSTTIHSSLTYSTSTNSILVNSQKNSASDYLPNYVFAIPIILSVTVPAYTVYTVNMDYTLTLNGQNGREEGIRNEWTDTQNDFVYDWNSLTSGGYQTGGSGIYTHVAGGANKTYGSHLSSNTAYCYNDTGVSKSVDAYSYYYYAIREGGNPAYTGSLTFTNFNVTVEKINAPAASSTTLTYNGSNQIFAFDYTTTITGEFSTIDYLTSCRNIKPTVLSAVAPDGSTIASSTYEIENLDANGNATSENGTFRALKAGTYKLEFNLTTDAINNGITWSDGSTNAKFLTFTINKKQITPPPIPGAPQEYSGSALTYNFSGYDKNEVKVTGVKVTSKEGSFTLVSTGTNSWATSSGGYPVTLDDSGSIVQVKATEAGEYTLEFGLLDTLNTAWATSTHSTTFIVERATITVGFGSPVTSGGFSWQIGDYSATNPGYLSVQSIGNIQNGEPVTVDLYWYKSTDTSTTYPMYTTGATDITRYNVTLFDSYGTGTYYLCAVLANDASGDNVNRNYKIATDDTHVSPVKNEVAVQQISINAGSASLDNIVWQYGTATLPDSNVTGATITYDKVGGVAVEYTVKAINFPSYCTPTYSNAKQSNAGTYTTTVRLVIDAAHQADNKMPNPADGYLYGGEGTVYRYINDTTCEIDFDWTIEQKEIDLANVPFEYSTDSGATWTAYNPAQPPEASGFALFEVQLSASAIGSGIVSATPQNYSNQYGPGVIDFEFDFQLDPNYKAQSGQVQNAMPYSMTTTGKQIQINWVRTTLKDASGNDVKDANGVPYYVYELDTTNIPASALPFIKYEYYDVNGTTWGSLISGGDIEKHLGMNQIISAGGLNANSQNPVQVYVRAVLSGMTQISGVDPYVLIESPSQPEYKKITIGDNRRAVDLTAGTVTAMTYGGTVNIADAYNLTDRTLSQSMPAGSYEVTLQDSTGNDLGNVSAIDFSTLNAGQYTLVFNLLGSFDNTHILTASSLPFEVKPVELIAPTLKDGVTLTFSGVDQNLKDSLQNWNDTYMEFASNSIHEAYHANTYKAIINIKAQYAGNYVFVLPASTPSTTKKPVKGLVDDTVTPPQLSNGNTVAALDWTINKFVFDTTQKSAWNFAKDGATLSFNGVPTTIKALTMGNDPTLVFGIAYYDLDGNPLTDVELKGGNKFQVAAYLDPTCADANDIEFKGQAYDPMTGLTTSPQTAYTVPKSGAAAFMGNIKEFMTKTWLGLPVWAWLLIVLALIILLIIIIVVACKRRKTKEEKEVIILAKEEEKARREEEKRRREEEREAERQRREEERRLQQEKLEAERELAKAKQEAELEKIRAQAQMAAGAGVATMAVQQPVQQQVPVQQVQTVDNNALARIEAEIARINEKIANQQPVQPQYMPIPVQQQMQPQYVPVPMQQQMPMMPAMMPMQMGGGMGSGEYSDLRADVRSMREEQRSDREVAALKKEMELEFAKMRADGMYGTKTQAQIAMSNMPVEQESGKPAQGNSAEVMGAIMAAFVKNIATGNYVTSPAEPVQEPQTEEKPNVANTSASYPSNAVITTTTTVDTTKKGTSRGVQSDDGRLFDIDGFYDDFENK